MLFVEKYLYLIVFVYLVRLLIKRLAVNLL